MSRTLLILAALAASVAAAIAAGASFAAPPVCDDPSDCGGGGGTVVHNVTLTVTAPAAGQITGGDLGGTSDIVCGGGSTNCSESYSYSCTDGDCSGVDDVTLTATGGPAGFSRVWSGCDSVSGAGACEIAMGSDATVGLTWQDTTSPTVSLSGQPAKAGPSTVFTAGAGDNSGTVAKVDFYIDDVLVGADFSAPFQYGSSLSAYTHGSSHVLKAISQDSAGLRSNAATHNFSVDRQASVNVSDPPDFVNSAPALTLTPDADVPSGSVNCKTEREGDPAQAFALCSSPYTAATSADGNYTVSVRVTDDVGNQSTQLRTFVLDTVAPNVDITSPGGGETKNSGFTPSFTATDDVSSPGNLTVTCRLDGGGYGPCGPVNGAPGAHTLYVRVVDQAGNSSEESVGFNIAATTGTGGGPLVTSPIATPSLADMAAALSSDLRAAARTLARQRMSRLRRAGKVTLSLRSLGAGRLTLSFGGTATRAKASAATTIAKGSKAVLAAGKHKVTLKLTRRGKALLKRGRRVKGKLAASFTPANGGKASRSRSVTLKRR